MPEVVTLGETCAVLETAAIGRMRDAQSFRLRPGGAEGTVAVGVAKLGHSSGWISRLGRDELGEYILRLMRGEGVDVSQVLLVDGARTGVFFRELLPCARARHYYYRDGSAFSRLTPEDLNHAYIASARVLHVTGITAALSTSCYETVVRAMDIAHDNGVLVSFDPNMRRSLWSAAEARPVMEALMRKADVVLPGSDDLEGILEAPFDPSGATKWLQSIGCKRIVMKIGNAGALVLQDGEIVRVPPTSSVSPVDVAGAGDAFAAGFIVGTVEGRSDVDAADLGNRVAGFSIALPGNIESLPSREELEQRVMNHPDIVR
jgi:2-dehydro-3-deoxygluconokinase